MDSNKTLIPGAIIVAGLLIAGAVYINGRGTTPTDTGHTGGTTIEEQEGALREALANVNPVGNDDHVRGNPDSSLVLVEYSDLECPFCGQFHGTAKQVVDEYEDTVAWAYRHFPLTQIHQQALPAALASECIADLAGNDAFWSFADSVFANQQGLGSNLYESLATDLGIDESSFTTCQENSTTLNKVQEDATNATQSGGLGTPFSVLVSATEIPDAAQDAINALGVERRSQGRTAPILVSEDGTKVMISGAQNIDTLRQVIDTILENA